MAKILVVDDDPDFVATTRFILEREGHVVASAANSAEAMECIEQDLPDLVILDVIMSTALDGLSVAQAMHDNPDYRSVPIMMVTSIADTSYAQLFPTDEYVHLDSFVSKPVGAERLVKEVDRLLSRMMK